MTTIVKIMPNAMIATHGPRVMVLAYDGLCTFEFGVAYEVFGLPRPEMGSGWYRHATVAVEPGRLSAAGGLTVSVDHDMEALRDADLIVVPGWRGIDAPVPAALVRALRDAHERGARLVSLCSGVFVLAVAGLLDGRRATTHWRYADALAVRFPLIEVEPDVLYVDNGSVLTAAGSAAGIDLCLHVVRADFGPEAANTVARRLVVPPHRDGGQAQFVERPVPTSYEGKRLGDLIAWMREHLAEEMPLASLSRRAGMSLRTFQRKFEDMTGLPPGAWLIRERVSLARDLLETAPGHSLEDVAVVTGFGSAAMLRHHFQRHVGVSPTSYRRRFAAAR